ncbi:MAG: bifunctional phosphopantothenoylcysteine decarboxylase/phosphopantothenate--cysteine ligase CoaBC [Bacteroidales bacterium]|nr:bifunctional phosphopantothenoylcysteine decarboxylase/phosphopantothenate--cysteine ligase CoaBC [Bacteroidales bacterium]
MLQGKHIIIGITGSIAAYKTALLTRLLIKQGATVKIVMTPLAKEFITPVTLATLSKNTVLSDFFHHDDGSWNSHVDLGLWADVFVVAPCTANTLAKMANGIADNLLLTTYLSVRCPVVVAPAMDMDMFAHKATQRNIATLKEDGVSFIEPTSGELASGLDGKGRMAEPETIAQWLSDFFETKESLKKKILITAGPTYEAIDPVRFIGNYSTGKMGFAIAEEAANRGAQVTLIAGPVQLKTSHPNITRIDVKSAQEMHDVAVKLFPTMDAGILSAAVADFTPETKYDIKIKEKQSLTIHLKPNPDIAQKLGSIKTDKQVLAGFALETNDELAHALGKLERKNFDFIVLNSLADKGAGFGYDTNKVTIIQRNGDKKDFELKSKKEVAKDIISILASCLDRK